MTTNRVNTIDKVKQPRSDYSDGQFDLYHQHSNDIRFHPPANYNIIASKMAADAQPTAMSDILGLNL